MSETNQKSTPEQEALLDLEAVVAILGQIPYSEPAVKMYGLKTIQLMVMKARETFATRPSPSEEALVERLAAIEHERWSGWMRHLFNKSSKGINAQGEIVEAIIPEWACRRWMRQMDTPYADLTEEEKESDRVEVRKTLAALSSSAPVSEAVILTYPNSSQISMSEAKEKRI